MIPNVPVNANTASADHVELRALAGAPYELEPAAQTSKCSKPG